MATHSSILAWRIPMDKGAWWATVHGSLRVGHDGVGDFHNLSYFWLWFLFHYFYYCGIGEGNGSPLQYSCLENPVDRGAWWAAVHGVAQSRTRLKRLSMHACIGEGNGNPLQYFCLENPRNGGAWLAAVYGVAQSRTRLKRLSSSILIIV